uniref:STAS domain-containing protein n=1 Tax=Panagrolaimus sp. PS1159 TaxID=55785 RepID=A0AC35G127_9BILA
MAHTCQNRKLFTVDLQGIDDDAGPSDIVLFLQNYAADHCRIVLNLKPNYTLRSIFQSMVNQMRLKWQPQFAMPKLQIKITPTPIPRF